MRPTVPTVLTVRSTDRVVIVACNAMDETVALLSGRDWWTDDTTPRVEYSRAPRFRIAKGWVSTMTRVTFGW